MDEDLLTAPEAAARFGVSARTARRRAEGRAGEDGRYPLRVAGAWVAPAAWWQALLSEEKRPGAAPGMPRLAGGARQGGLPPAQAAVLARLPADSWTTAPDLWARLRAAGELSATSAETVSVHLRALVEAGRAERRRAKRSDFWEYRRTG